MGSSNSILYRIANIFNTISLAASIALLVGISFEVTGGEKGGFADWYRDLQLIVCSIFFATAIFRLMIAEYRKRHWLRDLLFAVASVPYMDILEWGGANLEHSSVRILAFAPVLISIMVLAFVTSYSSFIIV